MASVARRVRDKGLTYLDYHALLDLAMAVLRNERLGIKGAIIEAGCALGGSAIVLASAKHTSTPLFVYDVFGTIPRPSRNDGKDAHDRYQIILEGRSAGIGGKLYYGYQEDLYHRVLGNFEAFGLSPGANNIHHIKGLFEDVLHVQLPISLAHIDCDWFDSVWTCLKRIEPHLVLGGSLVIDDYAAWSGCRQAIDEYFAGERARCYRFELKSRLHIVRVR